MKRSLLFVLLLVCGFYLISSFEGVSTYDNSELFHVEQSESEVV